MNSLSRSIESLPSTRNTPCLQQNSLNNTMMLNDNLHIVTPESSGYTSGNESINGNHHSTTTLGLSPRIFGNCTECGLRIVNLTDACYAMGYLYHNSCFICCCCKRTLRGKVFYKDQDKIYCEEDYLYCGFQQTVEKCFACGHIIAETILLAIGNTYHPGCFRCCICTKCLDGIPFTIDANNLIYCLPDYHLVNGPLCAVCGLVIMPDDSSNEVRRVVALGKEFHIDCYRCIDCKRSLGDEPDKRCYPLTEPDPGTPGRTIQRILCLNCHLRRIGAIPATSSGSSSNMNNNNYSTSSNSNIGGGGHFKSNSGVISHTVTTPVNTTRYATMPNRIHASNKLNTTNSQYIQHQQQQQQQRHPLHHSIQPPHQSNISSSSSSNSLLTHSYLPTTSYNRSAYYTTPTSTAPTTSLAHRNNINSTNNYALNWEKTRANTITNNNSNHAQYPNNPRNYQNSCNTNS
ncbi:LIM domain-containing protein isoform 2 [Schistosoma japonicum]|uniref:LIM domain-containing protein isoform 2 n=1 Tax=Schistosoma japonicum TaxID=6182 RepID=A0A4Z2D3F4_SCHJA|nr:LIM domain-containing protein isoform 2 [Schistosoma japonicum]